MSLKSLFLILGCILLVGIGWGLVAAVTSAGPQGVSVIGLLSHALFGLVALAGLFLIWRKVSSGVGELGKTLDCANTGDLSCRLIETFPPSSARSRTA